VEQKPSQNPHGNNRSDSLFGLVNNRKKFVSLEEALKFRLSEKLKKARYTNLCPPPTQINLASAWFNVVFFFSASIAYRTCTFLRVTCGL